jgi:serine protease AprX
MNYKIFPVLFFAFPFSLFSQKTSAVYFISFRDKSNSQYNVSRPAEFLSQKSIARRAKWNIPLDETDLPVNKAYIEEISKLKLKYISSSKWLNGICVEVKDPESLEKIQKLSYVLKVTRVAGAPKQESQKLRGLPTYEEGMVSPADDGQNIYGKAYTQIKMLHGPELHKLGFNGNKVLIAVLDAGFSNANQIGWYKKMEDNHQVIAIRDFIDHDDYVFDASSHGLQTLSCIAGCDTGAYIGSAPKASFLLLRTEDAGSEQLIEEICWSLGAEYADSCGADLITSSLGYNLFDDASMNHTHQELDGKTSFCSRAASLAVQKGILVVNSAGNDGDNEWGLVGFPADVPAVLTVGAVDDDRTIAYFSSRGNGKYLKPDVCAMGSRTAVYSPYNGISFESGTSFSAPLLAGMAACLLQAYPEKSPAMINDAIRRSADLADRPDSVYGYGIPDFNLAYMFLDDKKQSAAIDQLYDISFNPYLKLFTFAYASVVPQKISYSFLDENGLVLKQGDFQAAKGIKRFYIDGVQFKEPGTAVAFILKNEKGEEFLRLYTP